MILIIVPALMLFFCFKMFNDIDIRDFNEVSSAIGTSWMTSQYCGSCVLRPGKALFQSTLLQSHNVLLVSLFHIECV